MSDYIKNKTDWYVSAMERLVGVVQELSQASTTEEVTGIVKIAARELTKADGAALVLRDGQQCYYVEENSINPLWKGMRFPMSTCVSGWVMQNAKHTVIEDIYKDPRIPHDAYRPTFVKSLAMVPIRKSSPIGAIGNYWAKERMPSEEEVAILQALADTTSVALENIQLYNDLKLQLELAKEREIYISSQRDTLEIFTSALAHDLKEPVRTINSFSELVAQENNLSGKANDYFGHINLASQRVLTLIEGVLNYMQLDNSQKVYKSSCDMNAVFSDVLDKLKLKIQEKNANITCDQLPSINANSLLMSQLLYCLISNAISHNNTIPKIHFAAVKQGDFWRFELKDNGYGIEKKDQQKVFLPFKRTGDKSTGIGMGLAICQRILEAHSGKIWCESINNNGTSFIFTIPLEQDDIAPQTENTVEKTDTEKLANILLVDDMESDIELTETILERAKVKCNLLTARSGKAALDILRKNSLDNRPIDLVLLDINMPQMDGFETLEAIKGDKEFANVSVAMCTGSTYEKDRVKAESLGAIGYIIKPVKKESLEAVVANISNLQARKDSEGYCIQRKIS